MNRRISTNTIKILHSKSAGRCSIESCRKYLILEDKENIVTRYIGEMAHIIGHSHNGPRGDSRVSQEELSNHNNLILLCPTCHSTVDTLAEKYTIEYLREEKSKHEFWIHESLEQNMLKVSSPELIIAAKAIATGDHYIPMYFDIIQSNEKIYKNHFTQKVAALIDMGLRRGGEVKSYFKEQEKLDKGLINRLKNSFKEEYQKQKQHSSGDSLFESMLSFAKFGHKDMTINAASLAILCYLFQICEVFEK